VFWDSVQGERSNSFVSNKEAQHDGVLRTKATSVAPPSDDKSSKTNIILIDCIEIIGTAVCSVIDSGFDSCVRRCYDEKEMKTISVWCVVVSTGGRIIVTMCMEQATIDTVLAISTCDSCGNDKCKHCLSIPVFFRHTSDCKLWLQ